MNKIAIFGWSFNPPTLGHVYIIEQVFLNSDIKKIIITPDWLRLDKNYNISEKNRNELIGIFINELKNDWYNIELDTFFLEWKNKTDTTTYEVDKYFTNKLWFQPYHIFWTDISWEIKKWSWNPDKYIQRKLKKIFIPRLGYKFNDFDLKNYELLKIDYPSSISSTEVRNNIKKWKKITKLVSKNILKYIIKHKLYK